ncbi:DUF3592 domain-containing protein [Aldersonia sp. NBC_00410]|uniref:DUF3592 domain-containing protein n=1 Tax=Aldersonia sp. NBC_00410 TaxID=2975954 RepID=UPI00224E4594|nr:DUF3592 domain-containing protein [Aldersonia sp. NBC_00410]MCX5041728.1 DUF3592 domain-containing protein [Aldersonia sp. NBC_00410]
MLVAAISVTVLAILLLLAAWRDDQKISADMGTATAEVLSAGKLRSAVSFVTPDGVTHNPELGVLYPTNLTSGEHIDVEYSRTDPDLVRVAGRDARVAIIPTASVVVVTWAIALPALYLDRRIRRGRASDLSVERAHD